MPVPAGQPVIAVLTGDDPPTGLDDRAEGAEIRLAGPSGLAEALSGADVLLVWDFLSPAVPAAWRAADTTAVRWVHTASAGVDKVTFPEILTHPAQITNARGVFDRPIAEYVTGVVLAFAKDLPTTLRLQGRREWRHRETSTVHGRTAVVVGSGPIGRAIADMLGAVGLHTELVGRRAAEGVHAFDALPGLLPSADVLVLAAPLTDATRGMLDKAALDLLPDTARVVNVGRGGLVVEQDLVAALQDGRIAGAALDVFETEPLPADSPLWEMANVIVSPHMSGDVVGWRGMLVDQFLDNLARYRAGEPLQNVVDKSLGYVKGSS
ncbi:D-2-hydroxyacid dehydrogenase [Pseudonocardia kujensis]|uniref:D-2-hydroxyacid dehydrogenase n=1 Tax=Pseudonocardia kujensis TaxID=1128675 RepID=UPI001E2894D8|nr:D-2-hydroxyacid dehydrogenase [Pseudonocardia kujensis]MCE0766161.1 D-2-hydroxyacid dehydrogenase [Pseudonocardia kujensis]